MTLRVFEGFAGVGSQRMALRNIGIDHEVVAIAEIDKFVVNLGFPFPLGSGESQNCEHRL